MKVLDLFAGLGSATTAFAEEGWEVVSLDLDPKFNCTITEDILNITIETLKAHDPFDFIWASPPCEAFSVASIGHHWGGGHRAYLPKTDKARNADLDG